MKIDSITVKNFRQFYGCLEVDVTTGKDKNIILVGGKNGYGKTNFLISLVWCLYGEKISQIDDNFKKEIQKEVNYSRFMKQSLNWQAGEEGIFDFSVTLNLSDLTIPEILTNSMKSKKISITRSFDTSTMVESLSILDANNKSLVDSEEDKLAFINDYTIPLEAAKFVFFDAEKIAALAELSTKDEGTVLNHALGKMLGLDLYDDLIDDLRVYSNNLKKSGANTNLKELILNTESAISLQTVHHEELEVENAKLATSVVNSRYKIKEYDAFVNQNSRGSSGQFDRNVFINRKEVLEKREVELKLRFNELNELIPLAILSGKLEEVKEHLEFQDKNVFSSESRSQTYSSIEAFIERLFNQPPEPIDGSMSFKNKLFYYEKAKELVPDIFPVSSDEFQLEFEHDFNTANKTQILNSIEAINSQTEESFENCIQEYNVVVNEINSIVQALHKIDSDLEDEIILETLTKRDAAERNLQKQLLEIGSNNAKIERIERDISRLNQEYKSLIQKVDITKQNKVKLDKTAKYISVLQSFIDEQKLRKRESLSRNILLEMGKLMHKLNSSSDHFISDVVVDILPDGAGLKVALYNSKDVEIKKEILSQGEKQLYISSLIKAILKEAIQDFPIFIDTPLGRLDDDHIKNVLLYYYPDLANQVVILSTDNEITPKRANDIKNFVAKSYLLENIGGKTKIRNGYFTHNAN